MPYELARELVTYLSDPFWFTASKKNGPQSRVLRPKSTGRNRPMCRAPPSKPRMPSELVLRCWSYPVLAHFESAKPFV